MTLPAVILTFLAAYGINTKAFEGFINDLADKLTLPQEWKDAAGVWLQEHTALSAEKIIAIVNLTYAELTSPTPGYDSDHGRDA